MDIIWPFGGLSDRFGNSKQERGTSPDAVNVRGRVAATGRLQGGPREGATLVTTVAGAVRQLASNRYDAATSVFAKRATPSILWEQRTPQQAEVRNIRVDAQGNVYALDGKASVAFFNASGELVWKFTLPVKNTDAICRALCLDESGAFYVGVSEAGIQSEARLWKFRGRSDGSGDPIQEWEIELGCYVEDVAVRQGVLYAGLNWPDRGRSDVVAYRAIDTGVPEEAWRNTQAPYPLNALDVRESDGAIFTAHERNATRGYDLRAPDCTFGAEDATPADFIDDYDVHIWADLDAADIDGDGSMNSEYKSGDEITLWRDKSGNNRSMYDPDFAASFSSLSAPANAGVPTLDTSKRFGGFDAVSFSTSAKDYTAAWQELASLPNASTNAVSASSQRTLVPGYTDASYTMLIVCRATPDTNERAVFGIPTSNADTWPQSIHVNVNAVTAGAAVSSAGAVCFANNNTGTGADPGSPTKPYDSTDGWAVIVVTSDDGGIVEMTVNGSTVDDRSGVGAQTATFEAYLGSARTGIQNATSMLTNSGPFDGQIARVMVFDKVLSSTERQKLEGWAMWRYHLGSLIPGAHPYVSTPPSKTDLLVVGLSAYSLSYLVAQDPMLVKWDTNAGRPRWVVSEEAAAHEFGGVGYGVKVAQDGSKRVFSVGPKSTTTGGTTTQKTQRQAVVRCIYDEGFRPVLDHAGVNPLSVNTWEAYWGVLDATLDYGYHYPKLAVSGLPANATDGGGPAYLFVPYYTSSTGSQPAVYVYARDGSEAGTGVETAEYQVVTLASGARGYCCAVRPDIPEYEPGRLSSLVDRNVAVGTAEDASNDECVALASLVSEARSGDMPAELFALAVHGSTLTAVEGTALSGSGSPPATGLVQVAEYESRLWVVAEGAYLKVDVRSGIKETWRSKTSGEVFPGCRYVSKWGDRLALAGSPENPFAVFLTAIGNPEDCDLFPVNPSGAEAVLLSAGDAVTALVPMRNDLLLVGTQGKLNRLSGNPAAGGIFDDVADVDGVADGEAWCRDPFGGVYVFHGRGAVSQVSGSGKVTSLTDTSIRRRLEQVDLDTYTIRMCWNYRAGGFHVVPIRRSGTDTAPARAWFWEAETNAWWEDSLGFVPTSIRTVGRDVWVGCADGRILRFDETADTDDGEAIRWRVVGGPIRGDERTQVLVKRPRFTLAAAYEGATVGLYGGADAELPTVASAFSETSEGLGRTMPIRARGSNVWWRLSGVGRFAYEGGDVLVEPLGIRRRIP